MAQQKLKIGPDLETDEDIIRYMLLNADPDGVFRIPMECGYPTKITTKTKNYHGYGYGREKGLEFGDEYETLSRLYSEKITFPNTKLLGKTRMKKLTEAGYVEVTTMAATRWEGLSATDGSNHAVFTHWACIVTDKGKQLVGLSV